MSHTVLSLLYTLTSFPYGVFTFIFPKFNISLLTLYIFTLFLQYPKCTTCKKAVKWLKDNNVEAEIRHIVEEPLSKEEIKQLHLKSGEPIKKFFNTSGMKYRELGLKDKLSTMSEEECYELLASDGMLVKRPLAFDNEKVTLGFKEAVYETSWKK